MEYVGLFCLGVFAGAISTIGLRRIQGVTDWRQVLVAAMPVLLAGAAIVMVDRFRYSPAAGAFPLGLVVALLWSSIAAALDRLNSSEIGAKVIGWTHIAAAVGLTAASAPLVIVPAIGQVLAEAEMPRAVRIKALQDALGRANGAAPSRMAVTIERMDGAASATGNGASAPGQAPKASVSSTAASQ